MAVFSKTGKNHKIRKVCTNNVAYMKTYLNGTLFGSLIVFTNDQTRFI